MSRYNGIAVFRDAVCVVAIAVWIASIGGSDICEKDNGWRGNGQLNRRIKMKIDAVWVGWGEGADYYRIGHGKVSEIIESEYRICGDPYPCFLIKFEDGKTTEIRQVKDCNIHKISTTKGVNK